MSRQASQRGRGDWEEANLVHEGQGDEQARNDTMGQSTDLQGTGSLAGSGSPLCQRCRDLLLPLFLRPVFLSPDLVIQFPHPPDPFLIQTSLSQLLHSL